MGFKKIGDALSKGMGLMPAALSGAMGKENRGFGLGILPGLIYRDQYQNDEDARQAEEASKSTGMKKGGKVSSASKRADGCAVRGKTKGRMV